MLSSTPVAAGLMVQPGSSVYTIIVTVLSLLVAVVILAILAPRLHVPYAILLVLGGLLLGFVPGLPRFTLDPNLVFLLFLPPLLYSSAWRTSWRDFRANLRPISLLAIGLVLMTTVIVAIVAHVLIPGVTLGRRLRTGSHRLANRCRGCNRHCQATRHPAPDRDHHRGREPDQ